jgi:hypothetical protein
MGANAGAVTIVPRDSYRRTVYIASLGLQVRSDAGTLAKVSVDTSKHTVTVRENGLFEPFA